MHMLRAAEVSEGALVEVVADAFGPAPAGRAMPTARGGDTHPKKEQPHTSTAEQNWLRGYVCVCSLARSLILRFGQSVGHIYTNTSRLDTIRFRRLTHPIC